MPQRLAAPAPIASVNVTEPPIKLVEARPALGHEILPRKLSALTRFKGILFANLEPQPNGCRTAQMERD